MAPTPELSTMRRDERSISTRFGGLASSLSISSRRSGNGHRVELALDGEPYDARLTSTGP